MKRASNVKRWTLIVLLALGTLGGFGSGIASLRHHRHHHRNHFKEKVTEICADAIQQAQTK